MHNRPLILGSCNAHRSVPTLPRRSHPLYHSLRTVCEAYCRSQRTETSRRLCDLLLRLLLRCREAVGLVDPRRLFPGGVGLPAEQQHAMELRDAGRRSVLDERRGADAATVGTRTQCEVDDRNYDSPVRRLHH